MSLHQKADSYPPRSWEVLLIGGASGSGKTSVSYRLAQHFGVGITEVDDFQVVLEHMTTPEQQPVLHYWNTHPEAIHLPPEKIVELLIAVSEVLSRALEAVVANHLESQAPIVLEGDFILPALAVLPTYLDEPNMGRVAAVFLIEPDEAQLRLNYLQREPEHGEQTHRARVSWLYGQWLQQQAEQIGLITVNARPWDTVFERIVTALEPRV